jgi:hemolysin activation/secretion protein
MNIMKLPSPTRTALSAAILCTATLGTSTIAQAQDFPRVAPHTLPPNAAPTLAEPKSSGTGRSSRDLNQVIVPALQGVRLVPSLSISGAEPSTVGAVSDIAFARPVTVLLQRFVGKPLTIGSLAQMEGAVIAYYRARHRPFVSVTAPPQDVTGGVVRIVVTEFTVGTIKVSQNRWFSTSQIRSAVRLAPGDAIDATRLEADLAWLAENPFRVVDTVTSPGTTPGTTDIDLVVHDRIPVSVYAGYSNDGSVTTGVDRWKFGATWGNAFWSGQQLGYQLTTSKNFFEGRADWAPGANGPSFVAQAVTASIQLPWRHRIEIFGDYEEDRPNLGVDLGEVGHSAQGSLRYIAPLPGLGSLTHEIRIGYDFKTTNNNLDFGGAAVSSQTSQVNQFPLVYQGTLRDAWGQTVLTNSLVWSPGNLTGHNNNAAFQPGTNQSGTPFATSHYLYDRLDLERDTELPKHFLAVLKLSGQLASSNLLPSEQLNIGGMDTVRGYREFVAGGAQGILATAELRSPGYAILFDGSGAHVRDSLQGDVFFDYGRVNNVRAIPDVPEALNLASAGLGARYGINQYLNVRAEFGFPLRRLIGARTDGEFANLSITMSL